MKSLTIRKINPILKFRIARWSKYRGVEGYERIKKYLNCFNMFTYMYGFDERKKSSFEEEKEVRFFEYVLSDKKIPVSYARLKLFEFKNETILFVQGIVTHPLYQKKGYAADLLGEIVNNSEKYLDCRPKKMFAYIAKDNIPSKRVFQKIGETKQVGKFFDLDVIRVNLEDGLKDRTAERESFER